jgi:hypothetical protein
MMGNFEVQRPSEQQLQSCVKLVAWLSQEYKIDAEHIRGHNDAAPGQTSCPGKDFDRYLKDGTFRKWVTVTMAGESPEVKLGAPLPEGPTEPIPTTRAVNYAVTRKACRVHEASPLRGARFASGGGVLRLRRRFALHVALMRGVH